MGKYKKNGKIIKLAVILMICVSLYIVWSQYLVKNIEAQVFSQGVSVVKSRAVEAVNAATDNTITSNMNYEDYVIIEKDGDNNITFIQGKTMQMNRLSRQLAKNCEEMIKNIGDQHIDIPWGAFTGFILLSNYGKEIRIPLTLYSSVTTDFHSSFVAVGINQTRHSIYIKISVNMDIVLPLYSYPISFDNYVLVAESVIAGKIPEVYIHAADYNEFLDLIPD